MEGDDNVAYKSREFEPDYRSEDLSELDTEKNKAKVSESGVVHSLVGTVSNKIFLIHYSRKNN